jgi:glycerophosphoryl diester phosphodiesterase
VDGILTNRPELARQVLESRAEMSISERLLTEIAAMLRADQGQVIEEH